MSERIEPGIYFGLDEQTYFAAEGLSCSGMKHLAVSPLNYWHRNLNPNRQPEEETQAQRFGKAIHARLLEPERFADTYAQALSVEDFPGALVTVEDMKEWLGQQGLPATAKRKQELIDRITGSGMIYPTIWELEKERIAELTAGKTVLSKNEMAKLDRVAEVIDAEPYAKAALQGGMPEVSFFVREPETGIMLKARMDYVRPRATIDLKSFSNSRGKPTARAVFDAIYYENYYLQSVIYTQVREMARQGLESGGLTTHGNVAEGWVDGFVKAREHGFFFVFIESDEPFDIRIIQMRRAEAAGGDFNVYWHTPELQIADSIALYTECLVKYGDKPWREPQTPKVLKDTDLPQLMFAS